MSRTASILGRSRIPLFTVLAGSLLSSCGVNNIPTYDEAAKAKWSDVQNDLVQLPAGLTYVCPNEPMLDASLGFLALPPLLWTALRRDPRETATVVVILCCFAVWRTLVCSGPFARVSLNDSLLLLVMFFISISVPSMAMSADVLMRPALRGATAPYTRRTGGKR